MALASTKFYITTYIMFVLILSFLNLTGTIDLTINNPPTLSGSALFGDDREAVLAEIENSSLVGFFISGILSLADLIISLIVAFVKLIFYILSILIFTVEDQPLINLILLVFRILLTLEFLPYIKNMLHPTTQGSH